MFQVMFMRSNMQWVSRRVDWTYLMFKKWQIKVSFMVLKSKKDEVQTQKSEGEKVEPSVRKREVKGIVHFEIKIWYLSAYPKGIQDVVSFFLQ